jgi:hypothetical protein
MELIERRPGQPGQPGQESVGDGVLATILCRFTSPLETVSKEVSTQGTGNDSGVVVSLDDPWNAVGAAEVVVKVDAIIDAALERGRPFISPARRQILANERCIVRRLVQNHDPFLWNWPEALVRLLARWSAWDAR